MGVSGFHIDVIRLICYVSWGHIDTGVCGPGMSQLKTIILAFTSIFVGLKDFAAVFDAEVAEAARWEHAVDDDDGAKDLGLHSPVFQWIVEVLVILNLLVRLIIEVELLSARTAINVEVEGEELVRSQSTFTILVILNTAKDSNQLFAHVKLKVLLVASGWLLTESEKLCRVHCFWILLFQDQIKGTHTRGIRMHDDFVKLGPIFLGSVVETMSHAFGALFSAKATDKVHLAWNRHVDKLVELLNVGLLTEFLDDLILIFEGLSMHSKQ